MTTKLEQAARQALEALETLDCGDSYKTHNAAASLREALKVTEDNISHRKLAEQAEQEPVAWRWKNGNEWLNKYTYLDNGAPDCPELCEPLYAAPVRTKYPCNPLQDLTDDEIMKINVDTAGIVPTCDRQFHFARAVIQEYRRKNGIV